MTTFDDTRTDLTLDEYFIPIDAGIRFSAAMPNPNFTKEFVTLGDGQLLNIKEDATVTRDRFITLGFTSSYALDAIRRLIQRTLPDRHQLRRLPHAEQYQFLDRIDRHLNTADRFVSSTKNSVIEIREEELDEHGSILWHVPRRTLGSAPEDYVLMPSFELWDIGYMPQWTTSAEPAWVPFSPPAHNTES